jgi:prepilin-type N-terminal cleavage/methylation domain-containing protein
MLKAVAATMPTLKTGNRSAGYTLLEIVAVITLIGLLLAIVYPRIDLSAERVEVGYIGRLIQTDFKRMKDESVIDSAFDFVVIFEQNGYSLSIGEHRITRSFKYHFTFELPEEPLKSTEAINGNIPQQSEPATEPTDNDTIDTNQVSPNEIHIVKGEVSGEELRIPWQTSHFEGSLFCKKDGSVEWKYEKK